ncbi:MAG: GNAT family N-acetyltransferase, partial [Vicinamibacterales bacterium]
PRWLGGGVGRALLRGAVRLAASELAATTMRMTVIALRTELVAWYERQGYRRTGEREPFPYGDERFGRPRRDDLSFVVWRKAL